MPIPHPNDFETATAPAKGDGQESSLRKINKLLANGATSGVGTSTDAVATTDTGTFSLISLFKRLLSKLTTGIITTGTGYSASSSMTRPNDTTPYTLGDVIGPAVTGVGEFTNMGPAGGRICIDYASLELDVASSNCGATRMHLFDTAPTAIADNLAFNWIAADRGKHLGWIDFLAPDDLGDTLKTQRDDLMFQCKLAAASTSIFWVLQTMTGFTPAASTVKVASLRAFRIE